MNTDYAESGRKNYQRLNLILLNAVIALHQEALPKPIVIKSIRID